MTADEENAQEILLSPGQVAAIFGVDPKTVTRWEKAGKIGSTRTMGNHRRYKRSEVYALLNREDTVTVEEGE